MCVGRIWDRWPISVQSDGLRFRILIAYLAIQPRHPVYYEWLLWNADRLIWRGAACMYIRRKGKTYRVDTFDCRR